MSKIADLREIMDATPPKAVLVMIRREDYAALLAAAEALKGWRLHSDGCYATNSAYAEDMCNCGYLKARACLANLGE